MEVTLIFKTDTEEVPLLTTDLKSLDVKTYNLKNVDQLKENFHLEAPKGEFTISYEPSSLPLSALYLYNFSDEDIEQTKYLSVNFKTRPYLIDNKRDIYNLLSDFSTLKQFYELVKDTLTKEENLYFSYGIAYQNKDLCLKVLERFIAERTENEEGYFFARYIKDSIEKVKENLNVEKHIK